MKRILLVMGFLATGWVASNAQVIFAVENPPSLQGNYSLNYAQQADGWGSQDLMNPANAILDTLVFVDDGTADDSLGCNALVNGNDIAGQIAVVYRGSCQFGTKAKNAQNAGAIGVIIINNAPGDVSTFGMLGGDSGATVTIPVIMISLESGALLKQQILAGNVIGFIGNKFGYYPNDIGFAQKDIIRPVATSSPYLTSQTASEYSVAMGGWVFNYGNQPQTNVILAGMIEFNNDTLYEQYSTPVNLAPGDSDFVMLPTFSQATYLGGEYKLTYATFSDAPDNFIADNSTAIKFVLSDDLFAYAPLDSNNMPIANAYSRPNAATGDFEACMHFKDANASRLAVDGIYFSAVTNAADSSSFPGTFFESILYEWNDAFTDLNDTANFGFTNLNGIAYGSYTIASNAEQGEILYAPFQNDVILVDNQRYLFCVKTVDDYVFLGFNSSIDYDENLNYYLQPITPIGDGGTYYAAGFGTETTVAFGVKVYDKVFFGTEDINSTNAITVYPNPTNQMLNIALNDIKGNVQIEVMDLTGRVVMTQNNNVHQGAIVQLNVEGISNGQYIVRVTTEQNNTHTVKVVVNK